jgi:hypothetical protein
MEPTKEQHEILCTSWIKSVMETLAVIRQAFGGGGGGGTKEFTRKSKFFQQLKSAERVKPIKTG